MFYLQHEYGHSSVAVAQVTPMVAAAVFTSQENFCIGSSQITSWMPSSTLATNVARVGPISSHPNDTISEFLVLSTPNFFITC